jgi:hypothetical protein
MLNGLLVLMMIEFVFWVAECSGFDSSCSIKEEKDPDT